MIKKLLQFILWQDIQKPESKRDITVTLLEWCLVLILLLLFIVGILVIDMNSFIQGILLLYIIPNLLFLGASRGIALRIDPPSKEGFLMSGDQLTIFFTFIHVVYYLKRK